MKTGKQRARGFTMVEVMVVSLIVALLGVLVFGMVKRGQGKARQVACANNMRQIGFALQAYADDHGAYPETAHTEGLGQAWIYELTGYLGEFDQIRVCPADPNADDRLGEKGTSYVLNSFVFVPKVDPFGRPTGRAMNRPSQLRDPSRTILAFCCADHTPTGPGNDHTHSERWSSWAAVTRDIAPNRHTSDRANYLFADGRVEAWTEQAVKQKIESGRNFAMPPGYEP